MLGSTSDVDIDNPAQFCEVTISRSYVSRNELFERFCTFQTNNLKTRWVISISFVDYAYPKDFDIW